jgi:hypothetical protein
VSIITLYLRSIREAFRRWSEPGLEVVWKFAMASVFCILFALISIANAVAGDTVAPSLLGAVGCLALSAITGAYVIHSVQKARGDDNGEAAHLDCPG